MVHRRKDHRFDFASKIGDHEFEFKIIVDFEMIDERGDQRVGGDVDQEVGEFDRVVSREQDRDIVAADHVECDDAKINRHDVRSPSFDLLISSYRAQFMIARFSIKMF